MGILKEGFQPKERRPDGTSRLALVNSTNLIKCIFLHRHPINVSSFFWIWWMLHISTANFSTLSHLLATHSANPMNVSTTWALLNLPCSFEVRQEEMFINKKYGPSYVKLRNMNSYVKLRNMNPINWIVVFCNTNSKLWNYWCICQCAFKWQSNSSFISNLSL